MDLHQKTSVNPCSVFISVTRIAAAVTEEGILELGSVKGTREKLKLHFSPTVYGTGSLFLSSPRIGHHQSICLSSFQFPAVGAFSIEEPR